MTHTLVVGGNRGIGLELCRQLSAKGQSVITTCRKASDELGNLDVKVIQEIDVSQHEDILKLKLALHGKNIGLLIHNPGILSYESLDDMDFDRIEKQFQVNTLGPLRVVHSLLDNFEAGSKIGIVTSRMGSMDDNTSGGMYGYRISKAGANMVGKSLAQDLESREISVAILHPGLVATQMTKGKGITAEDAARGLIERLDHLDMSNTGTFWHAEGYQLPW